MNDYNTYTFEYASSVADTTGHPTEKNVTQTVMFPDDAVWIDVVDEFFAFLGSIYGYPISAKKYYEAKGKH